MQLVIITGLSGSGKSVALKVLEDGAYYTTDNLPAKLLPGMVDFLREAGYARVAVSIDARSGDTLSELPRQVRELKARGLADRVGIALAEQRLHHVADVGLEALARLVETLLVKALVIPLPRRILGFGVDAAVDQWHDGFEREACREIRHAQAGDADGLFRMVRRHVPHDGAAPVVADPHGALAAERHQQLQHVGDDRLLREILLKDSAKWGAVL